MINAEYTRRIRLKNSMMIDAILKTIIETKILETGTEMSTTIHESMEYPEEEDENAKRKHNGTAERILSDEEYKYFIVE